MKKLLLGTATLLLMANCSGSGDSEKTQNYSNQNDSIERVESIDSLKINELPTDSVKKDSISKTEPKPSDIIGSYTITGSINKGTTINLLANGKVKIKKRGLKGLKWKKMKDGAYYKLSYFEDDESGGVEWLQCIVGDNVYDVGCFASEYPGYDDYYYDDKKGRIVYTAKQKDEFTPLPPSKPLSSFKKVGVVTWAY